MVEAKHDWQANCKRSQPTHENDHVGRGKVMPVLGVEDWRSHGKKSIKRYRHQIKNGGSTANNIHRQVEITQDIGKIPLTPVGLLNSKCQSR